MAILQTSLREPNVHREDQQKGEAPMAARHPSWCVTHSHGTHRSRTWMTSRPGDPPVEVGAFLWQEDLPTGPLIGVGLDIKIGDERCHCLLDFGQARVLRYALHRLLDHAKQG